MELEKQTSKQAYIMLLSDASRKKIGVLRALLDLTEQQDIIISDEDFNEDLFLETINQKEEQIKMLTEIDDGFDKLYKSVREELITDKAKYAVPIISLKDQISEITDLSVELQVLERRNKAKLEVIFARKRNDIKMSRLNNQSVVNYYKSMSVRQDDQSYFYDKKK